MIAQRFEITRDIPKAWNNSVYFQLRTSVPFRVKCLVDSKIKRDFVHLVRNAGQGTGNPSETAI